MAAARVWSVSGAARERAVQLFGAPVLHQIASSVEAHRIAEWVHARDELVHTLENRRVAAGFGRAMAAPQVGVALSMIAFNLGTGPAVLLNPTLTPLPTHGTLTMWDDCFSFPDLLVRVRRWRSVRVEGMECDGTAFSLDITSPALSELLQHEVDHLHGVTSFHRTAWDHASTDVPSVGGLATSVEVAVIHRREYLAQRARFDADVGYVIQPTVKPTSAASESPAAHCGGHRLQPFATVVRELGMGV